MRKTTRTWVLSGACVAVLTAAFGWITLVSLRLERREREARAKAQSQELLRLALWRMDSSLAPLFAREAARPYLHYRAFYTERRAYDNLSNAMIPGGTIVASPLLGSASDFFHLHFQIGPDGMISSPQVPDADFRELAQPAYVSAAQIVGAADALAALRGFLSRPVLLNALVRAESNGAASVVIARGPVARRSGPEAQAAQDFHVRAQQAALAQNASPLQPPEPSSPASRPGGDVAVRQGGFVSVWCPRAGGEPPELFFVRSVMAGDSQTVQGIWVDWPRLRQWLLDGVRDLLPDADLRPVLGPANGAQSRMLASIPASLEMRSAAIAVEAMRPRLTPVRVALLAAWAGVLAAAVAIAMVLRAAIVLSERRLQFASAVTHELRTPLTTFRMYSEMLADGMVPDEQARREYLATLAREAVRLSNVVENVLLYARVEQKRAATRCEPIAVADLLARIAGRLAGRAGEARMELVTDAAAGGDAVVHTDCRAVEQILYNLVDNACKYAASATDRRVHLEARRAGGHVEIVVRDHGPGIPAAEERRAFEAFRRGSRDTAGTVPGVGLGLSLARGLARELGGDLRLVRRTDAGAAFVLSLPCEPRRG